MIGNVLIYDHEKRGGVMLMDFPFSKMGTYERDTFLNALVGGKLLLKCIYGMNDVHNYVHIN